MKVIGVVGGIASGKSEVTRMFESLGAERIDADQIGHTVLCDPQVRACLVERWGTKILTDGKLDRHKIAKIVFESDSEEDLAFLEATTHPLIRRRIEKEIEQATIAERPVVVDAALILETGWDRISDHLVFVEVPYDIRWQRAKQRGWTRPEFDARESAQLALVEKKARAHAFVDNSGSLEETFAQVRDIWKRWIDAPVLDT